APGCARIAPRIAFVPCPRTARDSCLIISPVRSGPVRSADPVEHRAGYNRPYVPPVWLFGVICWCREAGGRPASGAGSCCGRSPCMSWMFRPAGNGGSRRSLTRPGAAGTSEAAVVTITRYEAEPRGHLEGDRTPADWKACWANPQEFESFILRRADQNERGMVTIADSFNGVRCLVPVLTDPWSSCDPVSSYSGMP